MKPKIPLSNAYGSYTSSFRLDANKTPDTPEPDRTTRPAAAAAAAAALRGLIAPVSKREKQDWISFNRKHFQR